MSNFFLYANWERQTKEGAVVDGTSCCVILECLVMSRPWITWPVSLLTKWPTTICRFTSMLSLNSLWKRKSLLQKFTRDFSVLMEVCECVRAVFEGGWNILKWENEHPRWASEQSPSNSLHWTQHGESGWDHSRWQTCDCGHNRPNTWNRAQCNTGDDCEGSAAWTTLWDNRSNSESSASVSSDGWNEVLPHGNFQTSRTLEEMCTKKWRLCEKLRTLCRLRWCIWFVNNKACYFTKNCCSWLSVRPS